MLIDTAPDLNSDFKNAAKDSGNDLSVPAPGQQVFSLDGLYRVGGTPGTELEFTDISTLRRTVIYPDSKRGTFLYLPSGQYTVYYRLAPSLAAARIDLSMTRLGAAGKLALYAAKVLRLAVHPGRWAAVARHLMNHRMGSAVGISLKPAPTSGTPAPISRPPEYPASPQNRPAVSIIIPTKKRYDLLGDCLTSLLRIEDVTFEVVIIDNGATDPAMLSLLREAALRPNIRVIRHDIPFNFSRLCNLGAAAARHPLLLFLNDDVEALDGTWLKSLVGFGVREDVGVVGARLLFASGDLQHGGVAVNLLPGPGHPWRGVPEAVWRTHPLLSVAGEVDAVTGACLLIRREVFEQVNGFDEERFPVTLNDIDLCLKVRRIGLKAIYDPDATLLHKEGQSRRNDNRPEEHDRRDAELKAFVELYPDLARHSVFYPPDLRRDNDTGTPIHT